MIFLLHLGLLIWGLREHWVLWHVWLIQICLAAHIVLRYLLLCILLLRLARVLKSWADMLLWILERILCWTHVGRRLLLIPHVLMLRSAWILRPITSLTIIHLVHVWHILTLRHLVLSHPRLVWISIALRLHTMHRIWMRRMMSIHILIHILLARSKVVLSRWSILIRHSILVILATVVVHWRWWRHRSVHSHVSRLIAIHASLIHILAVWIALWPILIKGSVLKGWRRGLVSILIITWLSFLSCISKLDSSAHDNMALHSVNCILSLFSNSKSQESKPLRVFS